MPTIHPRDGAVAYWPATEGVLGVVGVAPWATLQFLECLYSLVPARKDWGYPRVIVDINTKIPSRGRHLDLKEEDPSPHIAATLIELANAGSTRVVVACNTAHILSSRWMNMSPVPVIDIVEAAVRDTQTVSKTSRAVVLASRSLQRAHTYDDRLRSRGVESVNLDSSLRDLTTVVIEAVKTGGCAPSDLHNFVDRLAAFAHEQGADTVLLGCTELSLLSEQLRKSGLLVVDSNRSLALRALKEIGVHPAE